MPMKSFCLERLLLLVAVSAVVFAAAEKKTNSTNLLVFATCNTPQWTCINGSDTTIESITYTCAQRKEIRNTRVPQYEQYGQYGRHYNVEIMDKVEKTDGENIAVDLSHWQDMKLQELNISGDCGAVTLDMHTSNPTAIHSLVIDNVETLSIAKPTGDKTHHPKQITFKNVRYIPELPSQMISGSDFQEFTLSKTTVGLIDKNAIQSDAELKTFAWKSVKNNGTINGRAIRVNIGKNSKFIISESEFPIMRPLSFLVRSKSTIVIQSSTFEMLQSAAISAKAASFIFQKNKVLGPQGPMYVQSPQVIFKDNTFKKWTRPDDLVEWSVHGKNETTPEDVSFSFVGNTLIKRNNDDTATPNLAYCRSSEAFIDRSKNCLSRESLGEKLHYGATSDMITLSTVICMNDFHCSNQCERVTTPEQWDPARLMSFSCQAKVGTLADGF